MTSLTFTPGEGAGLQYENLAGYVLKGSKNNDPFQAIWDKHFEDEINPSEGAPITARGQHILSLLAFKMYSDYPKSNAASELINLYDQIWGAPSSEQVLNIISRLYTIAQGLGYF